MGSVFGGGGGGGSSAPAPDTTTQFIREAPGIEERKLELMDLARQTAQTPIEIPEMQIQQLSPLEQAAITQAGQTGVGAGAVGQAITGTQAAMGAPNIQQFYNPYQSFVLDEINRQSAMRQNELAGRAVGAGAFGGGRQGIQAAEEERARLGQIGQAQAAGFQTALGAAQTQQARELAAAQQLGTLGQVQQSMAGTDIQRQLAAGGLERQLGQATLDAARQTQLQRSAEPLQRLEFLSNIYAAGPKSTSGITAATLPQPSAGAQALGAGLGVAQAYQNVSSNPAIQTSAAKFNKGGIVDVAQIKKYQEGGQVVADDQDVSSALLRDEYTGNVPALTEQQRSNLMMRPMIASLLTAERKPGQSEASAVASAVGRGLMGQQEPALEIAKFDTALAAAREKGKGKGGSATSILSGLELGTLMNKRDEYGDIVPVGNAEDQFVVKMGPNGIEVGEKTYDSLKEQSAVSKEYTKLKIETLEDAISRFEDTLDRMLKLGKGGDLPGAGPVGGRLFDFMVGRDGRQLRADFQSVANILLKDRSGAAVTTQEMERFLQEMSDGTATVDEATLFRAANTLRQNIEKTKMGFVKRYGGTKAMEKFLKEGGVKLRSTPQLVERRIKSDYGANYKTNPFMEDTVELDDGQRYIFIGTEGKEDVFKLNPKTNTFEFVPPSKRRKQKK